MVSRVTCRAVRSVAAAAKNDERDNDDPAAVVVTKQITEAVVHTNTSLKPFGESSSLSLDIIL